LFKSCRLVQKKIYALTLNAGCDARLVFLSLALRLDLITTAFDDSLVLLDLLLIVLVLCFVLPLHVISDERARAEPDSATDRGAQSRTPRSGTDKPPRGSSANCADAGAFFRGPPAQPTAASAAKPRAIVHRDDLS
jgi:hypothetical protein